MRPLPIRFLLIAPIALLCAACSSGTTTATTTGSPAVVPCETVADCQHYESCVRGACGLFTACVARTDVGVRTAEYLALGPITALDPAEPSNPLFVLRVAGSKGDPRNDPYPYREAQLSGLDGTERSSMGTDIALDVEASGTSLADGPSSEMYVRRSTAGIVFSSSGYTRDNFTHQMTANLFASLAVKDGPPTRCSTPIESFSATATYDTAQVRWTVTPDAR